MSTSDGAKEERQKRLNSNVKRLYHQTSDAGATSIMRSQTMLKGRNGLAGGGIYFALTPKDTNHKAHKKGPILECFVKLGRVKEIPETGDSSISFDSLLREGYDSVKIPRSGGVEYVVYNSDQVVCAVRLSEIEACKGYNYN